ncbi:MAG: tetratricopeptide repeat protein, partial [Sediminispirochaetaceae bacterium]
MPIFTAGLILILLFPCASLSAQQNPAIELYREGDRLLADGQLYEAIDHFKESLVYNPDYVEPLYGLSEAYFKLEEYEQALIYIRQARKLSRSNYNIAALEGRIYTGLGRYEDAEALFTQLLARQPYNREAVFGLAELHVAMGNIENALNSYRSALESDPYNRRGLLSAALLYAAQNNFDAAGDLIQTAVDTYPEDPVVHAIGAEYYLQSGLEEKAESHAWQAVALDPENEDALAVLIHLLFRQERFTEAVDAVDRSIGLDRRDPLLWFLRGTAYWELGRKENALDSFYTALDLRPSDEIGRIVLEEFLLQEYLPESEERRRAAEVRFDRGSAYERDNRVELARQEYRRGLMLHPYNRDGRVLYANTYKRSG